jgi:hypothetical protein
VMRLRGDERVSSIALVAESEEPDPGEDVESSAPEEVENPAPGETGKND